MHARPLAISSVALRSSCANWFYKFLLLADFSCKHRSRRTSRRREEWKKKKTKELRNKNWNSVNFRFERRMHAPPLAHFSVVFRPECTYKIRWNCFTSFHSEIGCTTCRRHVISLCSSALPVFAASSIFFPRSTATTWCELLPLFSTLIIYRLKKLCLFACGLAKRKKPATKWFRAPKNCQATETMRQPRARKKSRRKTEIPIGSLREPQSRRRRQFRFSSGALSNSNVRLRVVARALVFHDLFGAGLFGIGRVFFFYSVYWFSVWRWNHFCGKRI